MRSFQKEEFFIFYSSIHCFFFLFFLLYPSSLDSRFSFFLRFCGIDYDRSTSSAFLVNAQLQNLYLQVIAGTGVGGYNGDNQPATSAQLKFTVLGGVYGDRNGTLFVGDYGNYRLRKIDLQGIIITIVGTGTVGTSGGSGAGTSVDIGNLWFITGDTMGSYLYFSDDRFIWKYQISNGFLSRYAGAIPFSQSYDGDGQQATTALFYYPRGVSLSTMGLLYTSDRSNNRVRVIATDGIITTFAGSGPNGVAGSFGGDGGPAVSTNCKLYYPNGVYADTIGNVFIADTYNVRIRKVDASGIIRTFAGGGSGGGDGGQATSVTFSSDVFDVKGDRLGNIYISDICKIRMVNTVGIISTIAGTGTCGTTMTFSPATFSAIQTVYSLWVNSNFNIYFAESPGLIHKTVAVAFPTSQPSCLPSTQPSSQPSTQPTTHPTLFVNPQLQNLYLQVVAGTGVGGYNGDNQPATGAQLRSNGIYGDRNGTLFVGDSSHRLRKIDLQGIITTIAGTGASGTSGGSGAGTSIDIGDPWFITGDTMGSYLYFSDSRFIWKYQISNGFLSRYAGAIPWAAGYSGDGQQATTSLIYSPRGVWLSTMGLLYFSDGNNNRIRVVALDGIITTFAGSGPNNGAAGSYGGDDGPATSANCKLNGPFGVYADTIGNVFIADTNNVRIRKVDSSGIIRTFAGGGLGGDGGQATSAILTGNVFDVKGDRLGNIYISDNCKIRMVNTMGIISTIAGTGTCGSTMTFSPATSSAIQTVYSLWVNSNFTVYFAESPGLIHKTVAVAFPTSQPSCLPSTQPSSQPTTQPTTHPTLFVNPQLQNLYLQVVAGTGVAGYNGDNQPATSTQLSIYGIYGDRNGTLFVGDYDNYRIRKMDMQGIITTIAGTGTVGTSGGSGSGTSVVIGYPWFITGDTMGSFLYFTDYYFIWKYQISNGFLSRYAGAIPLSNGYSGDGQQATTALFYSAHGISLSTMGLLYIADQRNNRVRVIATDGIITTFAGSGPNGAVGSFGGDGGPAVSTNCRLYYPTGVFADTIGNVFIADTYNYRVRKMDSSGIIRTFAGGGSGGDGAQASSASFSGNVYDVKGDRLGNIYFADICKIRMVSRLGIISTIAGTGTCGTTLTFSPVPLHLFKQFMVYG
jgi:hypothetical protein